VAEVLKAEPDVEVTLVDGDSGELTVSVGDHVIAKKGLFTMPDPEKVRQAVRAEPAGAQQ
jgi:hypothetical protein